MRRARMSHERSPHIPASALAGVRVSRSSHRANHCQRLRPKEWPPLEQDPLRPALEDRSEKLDQLLEQDWSELDSEFCDPRD